MLRLKIRFFSFGFNLLQEGPLHSFAALLWVCTVHSLIHQKHWLTLKYTVPGVPLAGDMKMPETQSPCSGEV